jgi:hypothetical protein
MASDNGFLPIDGPFELARRGYDREQVDEHLKRMDAELRVTAADRDAVATQVADLGVQLEGARGEIEALRAQMDSLISGLDTTDGLSDRMRRMLRLAHDEASEIRARAEADAAELRSVAGQGATKLHERVQRELVELRAHAEREVAERRTRWEQQRADADERRAAMEDEHFSTMHNANAEAAGIIERAESERTSADAAAASQRAQIQEDFELAMAARRSESIGALQAQETASKAEAERRVRDATTEAQRRLHRATEQAEQRIAAAKVGVRELAAVRERICAQLTEVRTQLDHVPMLLAPAPEESRLLSKEHTAAEAPTPVPRPREATQPAS